VAAAVKQSPEVPAPPTRVAVVAVALMLAAVRVTAAVRVDQALLS